MFITSRGDTSAEPILKISADGGVDKFGQPILNRVVLVKSAN